MEAEAFPPTSQTTLAVLLGASEWPYSPELPSSQAFANAARGLRVYLLDRRRFSLPPENLLDLFDSHNSNDDLDVELRQFLQNRIRAMKGTGNAARDLLVYFVGHGGFAGRDHDFYLATWRTRMDSLIASGISMLALAEALTSEARHLRRIIILDCCFAAAAFVAFQAGPAQVALEKTVDAFEVKRKGEGFPTKGTTLLCSSGHKSPSLLLPDASSTMFTKAMLDALSKGAVHTQERLSLRQVKDSTADLIHELQNAPRPVVLSPDQSEGDVADIPFFPNPPAEEERARRAEAERLRQVEEKAQVRQAGQFTYPSRNQSSLTPEEIATTPNQSLPLAQLSQMKNSKEQWLAEAFKLLEAGFYEQALDILDHILMLDSNLAYAQSARGLALYHLNFYPAALTSLDLALTLNPKDVTAHYGRGLVLERLQRFADALSAFQQVTQLDANYVQAWRKMGAMLSELKRYEEALAAYEKILQLDRHDYDAYMGKRKVIRLLGRLE